MNTKEELKQLCEIIDKMDQKEHIEILKIIKNSPKNINITENSNGCFINMDTIDEETIKIRRIDKIEGWGQNLEAYICKLHKEYTKDGKRILPIGSNDTYPTRKNHLIIFTELSKDTKLEFKPENKNHLDKFEYEFLDDNGKLKITRTDKVEGWCQDLEAYIL